MSRIDLVRAVAPDLTEKADLARPDALARSAIAALLARPPSGWAAILSLRTHVPSARVPMPSRVSRPALGVTRRTISAPSGIGWNQSLKRL